MTTPPSWNRVKQILEAALNRLPAERAEFVGTPVATTARLTNEVQSLLAAMEQAGGVYRAASQL